MDGRPQSIVRFVRLGCRRNAGETQRMKNQKSPSRISTGMIRKLKSGQYRLYSRKKNAKTGRRRNLGTFSTRAAAAKHEREVQYFKKG